MIFIIYIEKQLITNMIMKYFCLKIMYILFILIACIYKYLMHTIDFINILQN